MYNLSKCLHNMYLSNIKMIPKLTQSIRSMRTLGEPKKEPNTKSIWKNIFGKYLLLTNTISSGVLMLFGDILSQEIEFRNGTLSQRYDYQRLFSMTMVGVSQGPMHHYIYKYLDIFLSKSDLKTVFKKIIIDQIVVSPIFIVSYFYAAGFFEGDTMKSTTDDLKEKFFFVYTMDWTVWPPVQFINFYWIKPAYRVLYINIVTMFYNVFLCYTKHEELPL